MQIIEGVFELLMYFHDVVYKRYCLKPYPLPPPPSDIIFLFVS